MVIVNSKINNQLHQPTYEETIANLKARSFNFLHLHLKENQSLSPYFYYLLSIIETLSLLWYIFNPGLEIFADDVFLYPQLQIIFQSLNLHEYLRADASNYATLVLIIFGFVLCQALLIAVSYYTIAKNWQNQWTKYIRKAVNICILLVVKIITPSCFGLALTVIYCNNSSPYHINQICYTSEYIIYSCLIALAFLFVLAQNLIFALFYYNKNPLGSHFLSLPNNYYVISKTIIKFVLPLYFVLDNTLSLSAVYMFCLSALFGAYLFFHRLFSIHTYNQRHFYVDYVLQCFLFWLTINNIISYYLEGTYEPQPMAIIYSVFCAALVALLLSSIEKAYQNKFIEECLQGKIKKQSVQKFVYILIDELLNDHSKHSKIKFGVYSKILNSHIYNNNDAKLNLVKKKSKSFQNESTSNFGQETQKKNQSLEVYLFLQTLISFYLEENPTTMLKALRCFFLCLTNQKSFAIHQSLELSQERLSLMQEVMMFQFRRQENIFNFLDDQGKDEVSKQFIKYYKFNQKLSQMIQKIELCAFNNRQYWQQLCESDPSIAKVRNLSTLYVGYMNSIKQIYNNILEIYPYNINATTQYFQFLLEVGVDIRQTLLVKEKLEVILDNQSKAVKLRDNKNQIELTQNQNLTILTLDSVGNSLGIVINSNTQVKKLLNFDRNEIIGKNITKLMPKIYTELHNSFMLRFIKSQNSHKELSQKKVTALNKNSLLVQIMLSVRMMASDHNSLHIIGIMKKMDENPKGLLMINMNSGEALAANARFMRMGKNKVSPKQLIQEEVKLQTLTPEINLDQLQKEGFQDTILEIGAHLEDSPSQLTIKIRIQLLEFKFYEGIKLGFLGFSELQPAQIQNDQQKQKKNKYGTIKVMKENIDASLVSSEIDSRKQHNAPLNSIGSSLNNQLPLIRKIEQFSEKCETKKVQCLLKVIQMICLLACTILAVYVYLSYQKYNTTLSSLYLQVNSTLNLVYYQSLLNINAAQLWNVKTHNYALDPTGNTLYYGLNATKIQNWLYKDILAIQDYLKTLVIATSNYDYDLEYNSKNMYSFSTSDNKTYHTTGYDGLSSYLSAATQFISPEYGSNLTSVLSNFHQQSMYIRLNGQQILPSIALRATSQYLNYFQSLTDSYLIKAITEKIVLLVISLFCLMTILIITKSINIGSIKVIEIYKSIKLWDINQLVLKCQKFIVDKKKTSDRLFKQRNSSILKIFPIKTILTILQKQKNKDAQTKTEKSLISMGRYMKEGSQIELEEKDEKKQEGDRTVKIQMQINSSRKIISLAIFAVLLMAIIGFSIFLLRQNNIKLTNQINRLAKIGEIRKHLIFIDYFAYRQLQSPDAITESMLSSEINKFYTNTQISYEYLGDPYPILKNIYGLVEIISQALVIKSPNITFTMSNFSAMNQNLQRATRDIVNLDSTIFHKEYVDTLNAGSQEQLIFTVFFVFLFALIIILLDYCYVSHVKKQRDYSLNMIKIIPSWLINRNRAIADIISH